MQSATAYCFKVFMKKYICNFLIVLLLISSFFFGKGIKMIASTKTKSMPQKSLVILLDAGHGGIDPGKVGVDGSKEKDINLAICLKLKKLLEESNVRVYLTRETDTDLSSTDSQNHKTEDLNRRIEMISTYQADFLISIHQNSYISPEICGPSTFYFYNSPDSKLLADNIQFSLERNLGIQKPKSSSPNDNYYLLKHSSVPTVIVECGFLSNPKEETLLNSDDYQDKVAKSIYLGIFNALIKPSASE